ncbi:hypothetical protein JZK55_10020 [Dissulfurispira thermophila]|uniref:Uncharacterized protein n=1 Tax=Dissulfurispira thermophila TaxID=2715679 RepID=A0A7G1H001_9BACT|nr:hypothetical protein JZK55_10020 [Dissulfurispira thermophila]
MSKSIVGKKILFLVGDKEFASVQERLFHIPSKLAKNGFLVDVVTYNEDVYEKAKVFFKGVDNINPILLKSTPLIWSPQQRDDFVRIYIRHTFDLFIPGTDLKYWKTSAFDDFRGHIASHSFSGIEMDYNLLLMPIPSFDEPPSIVCDVFYTTFIFHAKEKGIPVAGLQIYPVLHTPVLYMKIMDYFIVRALFEKEHYERNGVEGSKIFILDMPYENYCISTIEDTYKNLMFDKQFDIQDDEIAILIVNHAKYRQQINEVLQALSKIDIKKTLFFYKRGYHVRELSEDEIIEEIIKPYLERVGGKHYIVHEGSIAKLIMLCDVIIATTYIVPLTFAAQYQKVAVVYNPLKKAATFEDGVSFLNDSNTLRHIVKERFFKKKSYNSIDEIVKGIAK